MCGVGCGLTSTWHVLSPVSLLHHHDRQRPLCRCLYMCNELYTTPVTVPIPTGRAGDQFGASAASWIIDVGRHRPEPLLPPYNGTTSFLCQATEWSPTFSEPRIISLAQNGPRSMLLAYSFIMGAASGELEIRLVSVCPWACWDSRVTKYATCCSASPPTRVHNRLPQPREVAIIWTLFNTYRHVT